MSNASGHISAVYRKHEAIKKRAYGQRVGDNEHGVNTPGLLYYWGDGSLGHYLLQETGRHACLEREQAILSCNMLAEMQAVICCCSIRNSMHPWYYIIFLAPRRGNLACGLPSHQG